MADSIKYRYGDIYQLSPIIATLYAIISKVETFNVKHEKNPLEAALQKMEQAKLKNKI